MEGKRECVWQQTAGVVQRALTLLLSLVKGYTAPSCIIKSHNAALVNPGACSCLRRSHAANREEEKVAVSPLGVCVCGLGGVLQYVKLLKTTAETFSF